MVENLQNLRDPNKGKGRKGTENAIGIIGGDKVLLKLSEYLAERMSMPAL